MLEIFVSSEPGCEPCMHARGLAARAEEAFPGVEVAIVDVNGSPDRVPEEVIAVPMFLLDGVVLSLGNPGWEALAAALAESDAARSGRGR